MNEESSYKDLILAKIPKINYSGFEIKKSELNPRLFEFQKFGVQRALKLGCSGLFFDTGLGKTACELEFAYQTYKKTGKPSIIFTYLNIADEFLNEAGEMGYSDSVGYFRSQGEVNKPIVIANYEMLDHFDCDLYGSATLDESSILKNYTGKTKQKLCEAFKNTPFKLSASATPSPNDHLELGNHSEFLGIMPSNEMISRFFINDTMNAGGYRLAGHAEKPFWKWVGTWALVASKPSDIGDFSDEGYDLPELHIEMHTMPVEHDFSDGQLFRGQSLSATGIHKEARLTAESKAIAISNLISNSEEQWSIWSNTNYEQDAIAILLKDSIDIRGSDSSKSKRTKLQEFKATSKNILTKPSITGYGLNWQHHNHMCFFAGSSYSYETFYQALRRAYRFGQLKEVFVHIFVAESELSVMSSVFDKQKKHKVMQAEMIKLASAGYDDRKTLTTEYNHKVETSRAYEIHLGDCVDVMKQMPKDYVDFGIHSPPFSNLYIYSDSAYDMGNSDNDAEFFKQYKYCINEHYRILKDGGYVAVHCKDLPLYKGRDGYMGLNDFPQGIIDEFRDSGFELEDWVTIWKDPVIEMQRTKNHGLLFKNFKGKAEQVRQGMADYVLMFKKGAISTEPKFKPIAESVLKRMKHLWMNPDEEITFIDDKVQHNLLFHDAANLGDIPEPNIIEDGLKLGRLAILRVNLEQMTSGLVEHYKQHELIFHTRCALTDGSWLLGFRKWADEMPEAQVIKEINTFDYVGKKPPVGIGRKEEDLRYFNISVWQRYASPVWNDLDGLPDSHENIWMDIDQTNVLNFKIARDHNDEKHICPLQLDLIENSILKYTKEGDSVFSPFGGVGSEPYIAAKLDRYAVAVELKEGYFKHMHQNLIQVENSKLQGRLF